MQLAERNKQPRRLWSVMLRTWIQGTSQALLSWILPWVLLCFTLSFPLLSVTPLPTVSRFSCKVHHFYLECINLHKSPKILYCYYSVGDLNPLLGISLRKEETVVRSSCGTLSSKKAIFWIAWKVCWSRARHLRIAKYLVYGFSFYSYLVRLC